MFDWIKRKTCRHGFYLGDLKRISDDEVRAVCHKCGGTYTAPYGLALPGSLDGFRPQTELKHGD